MQQKQYAVTRPLWHEGHTEECCRLRQVHCTLKSARQSVFTERTVTHKNGMSTTQHKGHTEECCRLRQVHCTLKSARQSVFTERTVTQKWHVDHTARNATHLFGWSSGAAIRARSRHSGSKGPVRRNTNIYQRRITKFTMPCRSRLRFPPALGCSNVS